jgi:NAD(P)-dependent dehydrogenase (short-subunit alcohol dehydrogenase family)
VHFGPLSSITDQQFRKILDNNILSNHWLIQLVAPQMCARRDGAITIVSSIGRLHGTSLIGAYNISKAADFQLARCGKTQKSQRPRRRQHPCSGSASPMTLPERWSF